MPKKLSKKEKIFSAIREILEKESKGLRYSQLTERLQEKFPEISKNTIGGYIVSFRQEILKGKEKDIITPDRGFFIHKSYYNSYTPASECKSESIREEAFYESFANYLTNDLEECTNAIALGGNQFKDKWGTPDVIGVYKFSQIDPIIPTPEIITAEIKLDDNQLITAFGQACAYKLFSHKVYLVVPNTAKDISRVESLCLRFGIGLIIFNPSDPQNPNYEIRARAFKTEPDYYYLNEYIKRLSEKQIRKLFG
ncbi:MAG: hypothetical protein ABGX27_04085 [Desulfurobacteriaceae bacterium]